MVKNRDRVVIKIKQNQKDWKVPQWFILWTKFEGGKIGSTE